MASTGELVATSLLMWDGPAGRAVARVGLVGAGQVGVGAVDAGRVVAGALVRPSSCGCSHRPAASRPARTTTATKAADTERWDLAKAVHLRVHLPPSRAHTRVPGDEGPATLNLTPKSL
jgi:hypothetical protein